MVNLKKMIDKKKAEGKQMSPIHVKAKSSVLDDLMSQMDDMDAGKIKGLKKVTVSAPDKEGLEHGLAKATELVQKGPLASMSEDDVSDHGNDGNEGDDHLEESEDEDGGESPAEESSEHGEESDEDLHNQIQELQAKLAKRK